MQDMAMAKLLTAETFAYMSRVSRKLHARGAASSMAETLRTRPGSLDAKSTEAAPALLGPNMICTIEPCVSAEFMLHMAWLSACQMVCSACMETSSETEAGAVCSPWARVVFWQQPPCTLDE